MLFISATDRSGGALGSVTAIYGCRNLPYRTLADSSNRILVQDMIYGEFRLNICIPLNINEGERL